MLTNLPAYHTARALFPLGLDPRDLGYLYEPLPPAPADHPELDLFGVGRMQAIHEAEMELDRREGKDQAGAGWDDGSGSGATAEGRPGRAQDETSEPELMRARMLNEFVYCPRLFYYEQVEGVFVHNADTERGAAIHEKVDRGKGALPRARKKNAATAPTVTADAGAGEGSVAREEESAISPVMENGEADLADLKTHVPDSAGDAAGAEDGASASAPSETIHSRSAMMSSARLGVVAKMDLIEVKMSGSSGARGGRISAAAAAMGDLFAAREVQSVTPVDYKAGAPRLGPEANELWDADKMQLGLQILILRDNGYACNEGVIYYRATKQRVPLRMTPEVEAWIIDRITEARRVAASPTIPPPLVNSPKCVRCSLAPVCLPDETRLLVSTAPPAPPPVIALPAARRLASPAGPGTTPERRVAGAGAAGGAPRRLIAARDDERALYLNTQGCRVGLKSERLVIKDGDSVLDEVRLGDVTHVALFGNIQLSTQAVHELCEQEIPVAYFSMGGWFYGITRGHGLKNVHTRIHQFSAAGNPLRCLAVAKKMVQAKIRNHRTMLMRSHVEPPGATVQQLKEIASRVVDARGLDELLGMEGAAAAAYFQHFAGMIKVGGEDDLDDEIPGLEHCTAAEARRQADAETFTFDFTQRRRRPPPDPVNALLSLAYSLLAKDCTIAALAVGFDPYVGFYHQPRHGRPALALDLMEEFRPLVAESAVLTAINNRMVTPGHFVRAGEAVNLTPQGRRAFFHAYEQRMNTLITHPVFDYKVSYRRVLELQARLLARWLTGEISDYVPMVTR